MNTMILYFSITDMNQLFKEAASNLKKHVHKASTEKDSKLNTDWNKVCLKV